MNDFRTTENNISPVLVAQGRAALSKLLSRCFLNPDLELVNSYQRGELDQAAAFGAEQLPVDYVGGFLPEINHQNLDPEECRLWLEVEYNRLFVGPQEPQAPPFGFYYRTDVPQEQRGLVMGSTDIHLHYQLAGIAINSQYRNYSDHISIELDFFGTLAEKEVIGWENDDIELVNQMQIAQVNFLSEHLCWFEKFAQKVSQEGRISLYNVSGNLLSQLLKVSALIRQYSES